MNREKKVMATEAFQIFMKNMGLDTKNPELYETPRRVVDMYEAMLSGKKVDIKQFFNRPLPTKHSEMTVFSAIPCVSLCPHHLMPFFGKVYIAYIPDKQIVGFSKYESAVRALSRQAILQETFTSKLADTIDGCIKPIGVMVVVRAFHTCTCVPGIYDYDTGVVKEQMMWTTTSALRGLFLHDLPNLSYSSISARNEALALMKIEE
jgi:GTP cyclohydrolase I